MTDLIPTIIRIEFRELCVGSFVLRAIDDFFEIGGFRPGKVPVDKQISGARRARVEEYYATINFSDLGNAKRFLEVINAAVAQSYLHDPTRNAFLKFCQENGLHVKDRRIYLPVADAVVPVRSNTPSSATLGTLRTALLGLRDVAPQQRGFAFERFLHQLFEAFELSPRASFRLTGEQIDGSFELTHDTYLVEAKWQAKQIAADDLYVFQSKVEAKSSWARGVVISDSGFSSDGLQAFARGRSTRIIGISGQDLYMIIDGRMPLVEAIQKKVRHAAETGEFYVPIVEIP